MRDWQEKGPHFNHRKWLAAEYCCLREQKRPPPSLIPSLPWVPVYGWPHNSRKPWSKMCFRPLGTLSPLGAVALTKGAVDCLSCHPPARKACQSSLEHPHPSCLPPASTVLIHTPVFTPWPGMSSSSSPSLHLLSVSTLCRQC